MTRRSSVKQRYLELRALAVAYLANRMFRKAQAARRDSGAAE